MRYLLVIALAVLVLVAPASAQTTVTCSASNVSASDSLYYNQMLADINATRTASGLATLPDFNAHCSDTMLSLLASWISQKKAQEAARVGQKSAANGLLTAEPAACSYANLAAGCTRNQVACYVLTGKVNTDCK